MPASLQRSHTQHSQKLLRHPTKKPLILFATTPACHCGANFCIRGTVTSDNLCTMWFLFCVIGVVCFRAASWCCVVLCDVLQVKRVSVLGVSAHLAEFSVLFDSDLYIPQTIACAPLSSSSPSCLSNNSVPTSNDTKVSIRSLIYLYCFVIVVALPPFFFALTCVLFFCMFLFQTIVFLRLYTHWLCVDSLPLKQQHLRLSVSNQPPNGHM